MKSVLFLLLLCLPALKTLAQEGPDGASIPDSLRKNANAVLRNYVTTYERISLEKCIITVDYTLTVLNKNGEDAAALSVYYDRNSEIKQIKGELFNSRGELEDKAKKKDFRDYASNASYTLFSDNRMMYHNFSSKKYPYTVRYTYRTEEKGLLSIPFWFPQKWYNIATENASFSFETTAELGFKFKELNTKFLFTETKEDEKEKYTWKVSGLKPVNYEVSSPDRLDIFPCLLLALDKIAYEDTQGDFSTWNNYGKWVYGLLAGQDIISEDTKLKIKSLTDTIPDKKDKIKAVYQYMQSKTRYVNIALGIGGFQPVSAESVDEKGYGDCKGLSNYTRALLKTIGIEAFYAEIGNGDRQKLKYPQLPNLYQTNHVILCVPAEKDTIWLECTSQNMPFGYIGGGNSDRYALLVTENGGVLARTPTYRAENNIRSSVIKMTLKEDGTAFFDANWTFENYLYEQIGYLVPRSKKEQKETLLKNLSHGNLTITDFSIENVSDKNAKVSLYLNGKIGKHARKAGKRLFIKPEFLYANALLDHISSKRKQDFCRQIGFVYQDSLEINPPPGYQMKHLPEAADLSSVYGTYHISYKNSNDKLLIIRRLKISEGVYAPSSFTEINLFLNAIAKADKTSILFEKE